ncbi:acyl-CoA dehydrogenase/oxidase [Infundibulicybe gibba]|nr:acyl-CoA dehydrogenase/oxidase [Infundibulicybe gibba]
MRIEDGFQQVPPAETHPYMDDTVLPSLLKRLLPSSVLREVEPDLVRFGNDVNTTIRALGASHRVGPPQLLQYDQWGRRVDILQTSEGWKDLKAVAQREGFPAIFYERTYGEHSRVYGFAKMLLMLPDSHEVFCPLSMTDGTARVIELVGTPEMKRDVFPRLVSRDPGAAFTSGQWMTERPGGSDVSQTETTASPDGSPKYASGSLGTQYTLDGFKWFSSATTVTSPLPSPARASAVKAPSTSNNIYIHRLKNKIGTHTLPTAELSLDGTRAYMIGPPDQGIKNITPVLNITRVYSALASVSSLRRCLTVAPCTPPCADLRPRGPALLQDRHCTPPTLPASMAECGVATASEAARLRMLTPVAKAFAAEKACAGMEDAMTALGGAGYMEENGFGRLIRDGLVEKIWEGTTTVLSLDVARAVRDPSVLDSYIQWAKDIMAALPRPLHSSLHKSYALLTSALAELQVVYKPPIAPLVPRPALMLIGHVTAGLYLLEHAVWAYNSREEGWATDVEVCRRWIAEGGAGDAWRS